MGFPELPEQVKPECFFPWTSSYITSSGDVLPCCFIKQRSNSRVSVASMGNIKEQSYSSIWKGKKYNALRKSFIEKNFQLIVWNAIKCRTLKNR